MRVKQPFTILRADGSFWDFDACMSERQSPGVSLTRHPVEVGAKITDHAQVEPPPLAATVVVTETPFSPTVAAAGSVGIARVQAAIKFLNGCAQKVLTVGTTKHGTRMNMMLVRWPYDATVAGEVSFDLLFEEVRFALAQSVTIPPAAPTPPHASSLPDGVDLGAQATIDLNQERLDAAVAAQDKSAAYSILQALGGV